MKRRNLVLSALALVLVLCAGIGSAWAYFTTYAEAQGGRELHLGDRTEVTERFSDWTKRVVITSAEDSEPVYVRARAFWPEEYELTYSGNGLWTDGGDGYYYYQDALNGGGSTSELLLRIGNIPEAELLEDGQNFNVVVIYETIPVEYAEDGTPLAPQAMDWSKAVENGEGGADQ